MREVGFFKDQPLFSLTTRPFMTLVPNFRKSMRVKFGGGGS